MKTRKSFERIASALLDQSRNFAVGEPLALFVDAMHGLRRDVGSRSDEVLL
ncbi:MAG TPA: hypothetical protein VFJ74_05270 [Gemmatimonadaceae bacterium]|nr:hypothetical protein [Gemmatimonadaceae bacterium]